MNEMNDFISNQWDEHMVPLPNLQVRKLVLLATNRNYDGIYKRDFRVNVSSQHLNTLADIMYSNPSGVGFKLPSVKIANNLSGMIDYNPVASRIDVPNGWSERRCIFILLVDCPDTFQTFYIQGYTDYDDPSYDGNPDPNMTFYINTIHAFVRVTDSYNTPFLQHQYSFNVIADSTNHELYMYNGMDRPHNMLIRPTDVYTGLAGRASYNESGYSGVLYNSTACYDSIPKASYKTNVDPVYYMERTINSFITSKNVTRPSSISSSYMDDLVQDTYSNSASILEETSVSLNPFIVAISSIHNVESTCKFKLNDLAIIDNTIDPNSPDGRFDYFTNDSPYVLSNPLLDVVQGENHLQPKIENLLAHRIVNTVSAFMAESMITSYSFSITNRTINGAASLVTTGANSILWNNSNMLNFVDMLRNKIEVYLLPHLLEFGVYIDIHCQIDIFMDSSVSITFDNNPEVIYVFPTFADGLCNSLITDTNGYNNMLTDIDMLTDKISEVRDEVMGSQLRSSIPAEVY